MSEDGVVVLSGALSDGRTWLVRVSGDDENFRTMVEMYDGERRVRGSGFAGPKLRGDGRLASWRGSKSGTPDFVMARTDPGIDRAILRLADGTARPLEMTGPVAPFGLRFAAGPLEEGETLSALEIYSGGEQVDTWPQWPLDQGEESRTPGWRSLG
jgi:hypothetical protein